MKQIALEHLADFKYLSQLNLSDDGRYAGYVVSQANLDDNQYDQDIWTIDLHDHHKTPKRLTASKKAGNITWLKDSHRLIYSSLKDEAIKKIHDSGEPITAYYMIDMAGGESVEWFRLPLKASAITPIDDNRYLVLATYHKAFEQYFDSPKEERPKILNAWKEENDYEVIEEIPFWSNGGTFTRGARQRLYLYSKDDGHLKAITQEDEQVLYYKYDESVDQIVIISKCYRGKMPLKSRLSIASLELGVEKIVSEDAFAMHYAYFLDGDNLVFLGHDGSTHGLNQNAEFFKVNLKTGECAPFAKHFKGTVGNTVGSDARFGQRRTIKDICGDVYFVTTENENAYLYHMNTDGLVTSLTSEAGSVDDFDIGHGVHMISAMRGNRLAELYELKKDKEIRYTAHNAWFYDHYQVVTPEPLRVMTAPNVNVDGWVMKPAHFDPLKKYPSILNIHGGPKTVYGTVYYHEMQYWANSGYFVFFCNPRGSDGKGNAFADIRGKYGTIDYTDIMAFTDAVLAENPAIDQDRMFVTGGSYGGFMTNWIIGHTHRFRAAASQRSISNWTTEYGVTDIGYYFVPDQTAADPWQNYEKLWEQSPLKYANEVKTPTLFIHSDMDYRCWLPEALQMFTALKDFGVETRMCIFKGENHELSRSGKPKHRIRRIFEITDWFNRH